MLGLEPTSTPTQSPEPAAAVSPAEGLDALSLDDFSLPTTSASAPVASSAPPYVAAGQPAEGLLDLDSFSLGGETASPPPEAVPPSLVVPAMDFAMPGGENTSANSSASHADGGQELVGDFDFDLPVAPPAPPSVATPAAPARMQSAALSASMAPMVRRRPPSVLSQA